MNTAADVHDFCSVRAADAGDRARVLEEFWQRKREALANKNRGAKPIGGPSVVSLVIQYIYQFCTVVSRCSSH